CQLGWFAYW
nr:immunoglobulin heavy chain junction region [Mus musculus]MBK4183773.1 immunoglobulin heavy chain junction region [Mus musculus]